MSSVSANMVLILHFRFCTPHPPVGKRSRARKNAVKSTFRDFRTTNESLNSDRLEAALPLPGQVAGRTPSGEGRGSAYLVKTKLQSLGRTGAPGGSREDWNLSR